MLIDLRSESEFREGNIPGSVNLPLFQDKEWILLQKNKGKKSYKELYKKIYELSFDRTNRHSDLFEENFSIYCKSGFRCEIFRNWFPQYSFNIKNGGYKSYRKKIKKELNRPYAMIRLSGKTGSGKTALLETLEEQGFPVLNLEKIACHKGSAFGKIGYDNMVTLQQEQFENELAEVIRRLKQPIFVEMKPRKIGKLLIPPSFYQFILKAPEVYVNTPFQHRVERLVNSYCKDSDSELKKGVLKLRERLGEKNTVKALDDISKGNYHSLIVNLLEYYDTSYIYSKTPHTKNIEINFVEKENSLALLKGLFDLKKKHS